MPHSVTNPFHRHAEFEFPRQPLSPPETNIDSAGPAHTPPTMLPRGIADQDDSYMTAKATESPSSRFKRVSTLAYHTSRGGESRERTTSKTAKPLIIVIPPAAIQHEHGQLGHTLSLGPPHRLSQGILMPLFPTMYGQLTAIAREFNFPSTTGLCIYFHFTDGGMTITPRVSDESWQMIWSHAFDDRSASPSPFKPPINGKIEFDIDPRQARWYSAWVSSARKDSPDYPVSVAPSIAFSIASHDRMDSKTTFPEEIALSDMLETNSVRYQPRSKHVPRKLSLVDKVETQSVRSHSRPPPLNVGNVEGTDARALSTIVQEDEPATAKLDLTQRVNSWIATSKAQPTNLAKNGQTSLEPANMPNTLPDDVLEEADAEEGELNLEEFSWSVSSQGPEDDDIYSIASGSRLPSIHAEHRMATSVCMTPSVCTSFGPFDYDLDSPVASSYRLPSPDVAWRMLDDVPPTPTTATSWGAPSYPPSPYSQHSFFSLDMAHRAILSRPVTPTTATSWGAPSWPASPAASSSSMVDSVHLGARGEFSLPVTPTTATSWGAPLSYPPSPMSAEFVQTPDVGDRTFDLSQPPLPRHARPWNYVWPYHESAGSAEAAHPEVPGVGPWHHAWPYTQRTAASHTDTEHQSGPWGHAWPYMQGSSTNPIPQPGPWGHAWPYMQGSSTDHGSHRGPWGHAWPYTQRSGTATISSLCAPAYPYLEIYEHVYPHFNLYPSPAASRMQSSLGGIRVCLGPSLPYPANLGCIYPAVSTSTNGSDKSPVSGRREARYPFLKIYPDVYPHFDLYPHQAASNLAVTAASLKAPSVMLGPTLPYPLNLDQIYPPVANSGISVRAPSGYPSFQLYAPVYPYFDLYPSTAASSLATLDTGVKSVSVTLGPILPYPKNLDCIYPLVSGGNGISVRAPARYPVFELYAPVYPHVAPYPALPLDVQRSSMSPARIAIQVVPGVYPHFDLYPPVVGRAESTRAKSASVLVRVGSSYPTFNIYPAVYPAFDLYPAVPDASSPSRGSNAISVALPAVYPVFNLYPAVYPVFDIYPEVPVSRRESQDIPVMLSTAYPIFNLYPAVDIYPEIPEMPVSARGLRKEGISITLSAVYPVFNIYPAVYPAFDIYPEAPVSAREIRAEGVPITLSTVYPVFNLYPAVYPAFDIYPAVEMSLASNEVKESRLDTRRTALSSSYPIFNLYPAVYPSLEIYPALPQDVREAKSNQPKGIRITIGVVYPVFNLYPSIYPVLDIYPAPALQSLQRRPEISVTLAVGYPSFVLYPAVYPHFELYPSISRPQVAALHRKMPSLPMQRDFLRPLNQQPARYNLPSVRVHPPTPATPDLPMMLPPFVGEPSRTETRRKYNLTHSELHAMVMMERSFDSRHQDQDEEEADEPVSELPSLRHASPSRVAPTVAPAAPRRDAVPAPATGDPPRRTRPRQGSTASLASRYSVVGTVATPPSRSPEAGAPLRRSASSAARPTSMAFGDRPVGRLTRSGSIGLPSHPAAHIRNRAAEPKGANAVAGVRSPPPVGSPPAVASPPGVRSPPMGSKRDSLVLQRVRAFNSVIEAKDPFSSLDALSEFPMPPRPPLPLPPLPKIADRA
ncbi:hypothetical protein HGRIS_009576 [Hohenbuehelia grisea]|uniref:Uncharacterized protein n=1 Tax=Hohenbuehelia grisea TaxID=104357 RepID=A0ABR3J2Y4_9AGAR